MRVAIGHMQGPLCGTCKAHSAPLYARPARPRAPPTRAAPLTHAPRPHAPAPTHTRRPAPPDKLSALFARIDTNGDGRISFEEFNAAINREPILMKAFLPDAEDKA